ncbi:MAG: restriction endonuclease subunit S [Gammaproteobacteria bacterium]|nr:restriction endonuclease subunit S [Gammaproteobacteria bacterium]
MTPANWPAYGSYKESGIEWIGSVPAAWSVERGKWLFVKKDRPTRLEDEVVTCFRDGQVTLRRNRRTDGFTNALKEHGYQGIRKGDLVIHAMDAFAGAIGVSDSDGKATPVYSACVPRQPGTVDPHFYAYYMRHLALSGLLVSLAKGIRERSTDFRYGDFADLQLVAPPLAEQRAISAFLDEKCAKVDEAVRIKEEQIALLRERRQILTQEAVTRGLNPDAPMKDSGIDWIGRIPAHWKLSRLRHLTTKIGSGLTPTGGALVYTDDGVPLLRSQNILFGAIDLNAAVRISPDVHARMSNSQVRPGDVLLNITGGSIGRCHYVTTDEPLNVNQHVCIIRPNSHVSTVYLNLLLGAQLGQRQIWWNQQGGGREGLNFASIKEFLFPIPPLNEQQEIERSINHQSVKIDRALATKRSQIAALKEYKTTLINAAVTGKIKVA